MRDDLTSLFITRYFQICNKPNGKFSGYIAANLLRFQRQKYCGVLLKKQQFLPRFKTLFTAMRC